MDRESPTLFGLAVLPFFKTGAEKRGVEICRQKTLNSCCYGGLESPASILLSWWYRVIKENSLPSLFSCETCARIFASILHHVFDPFIPAHPDMKRSLLNEIFFAQTEVGCQEERINVSQPCYFNPALLIHLLHGGIWTGRRFFSPMKILAADAKKCTGWEILANNSSEFCVSVRKWKWEWKSAEARNILLQITRCVKKFLPKRAINAKCEVLLILSRKAAQDSEGLCRGDIFDVT